MSDLANRDCVPCRGGIPPMRGDEIKEFLNELGDDWKVIEDHHLTKRYEFKNFLEAQQFVTRVGDLSEQQGHHPDICFGWGYVELTIYTHKIAGLSESDFVLAAKIDAL